MKMKINFEIDITHEYNDMNDFLDCVEEDVQIAVGNYLADLFGNTSNITCNVISTERIRDNMRLVFNINDKTTLSRMDTLIKRMQVFNPGWGEANIRELYDKIFLRDFNMHLSMLENIVEEKELKQRSKLVKENQ